ncbi:phage minor head protein [Bacillus safensis]|uniref:phage minor head protein n=1 Tax=Bacillus safensis TaxID=561879 RepID=UPI002DBDEB58|nr:phage minor head protein [Bacillus safensis]MEC3737042.1 phage minor head protein [Bacillus safensis]
MDKVKYLNELLKPLDLKERGAMRRLKKLYREASKEFMSSLTNLYEKLDQGEDLSYADINQFDDIEALKSQVIALASKLDTRSQKEIIRLLEDTYDFSYDWLASVVEAMIDQKLRNATPSLSRMVEEARKNAVFGLKLTQALEKHRAMIVKDINEAIERGFIERERFSDIARRVRSAFDSSYYRSTVIARTEAHRVREKATHKKAEEFEQQGVVMEKVWNNVDDERVRQTRKANHKALQGQRRKVNEQFDLGNGVTAVAPGQSGSAANDIHCRCFLTYEVVGLRGE